MSKIIKFVSVNTTPVNVPPPSILATAEALEVISQETELSEVLPEEQGQPINELAEAAKEEADNIIAAAQDQAADILATARQQAEQVKAAAQEEGFQLGFQQGMTEGMTQGEAAAQEKAQEFLNTAAATADQRVAAASADAAAMLAGAERQIVDIAMTVARKILAREIEENPLTILPIVKAALGEVSDQEQLILHVSPADYDFVVQAKPELQAALSRDNGLSIIADESLKDGDCVVDSPYGTIDARIDVQLEMLKAVLRDIAP